MRLGKNDLGMMRKYIHNSSLYTNLLFCYNKGNNLILSELCERKKWHSLSFAKDMDESLISGG